MIYQFISFSPNLLLEAPFPTIAGLVLVGDITARAAPVHCFGWWGVGVFGRLNLFSRRIKGLQVETHMEASLVHNVLKKALLAYSIQEQAVMHSDRGGQYIDKDFGLTPRDNKLRQSMSRADDPYDNAFMPGRRRGVVLV